MHDDEKGDDSNDNDADLTPNTLDTANKAIYPGLTFWIVMEAPQAYETYASKWTLRLIVANLLSRGGKQ